MTKLTCIWPSIKALGAVVPARRASRRLADLPRLALVAGLIVGAHDVAEAQQVLTPGFYLGAGLIWQHDSNLFRSSGDPTQAPIAGVSIETASLLGGFDQTYGRQHLYATAALGRVIYGGLPASVPNNFNYTTEDLHAGWDVSLPSNVNGNLKLGRSQTQARFQDIGGARRDVVTRNEFSGLFDVPVGPGWGLLAGTDLGQIRNSNTIDAGGDTDSTEFDGGARYQTGSENRVDLLLRTIRTRYPNANAATVGAAYRDRGADARVNWRFSGASRLEGHAGYLQRRDDQNPLLNFSGPAYDMSYFWDVAAHTQLVFFAGRDTGASGDNFYSTATTKTYRIAPTYAPTAKTSVAARYEHASVKFSSDLAGARLATTSRSDTLETEGLTLNYDPLLWLHLSLDWYRQRRSSNLFANDYAARVTTLSGTAKF